MKKLIIPVILATIGTGTAFATNASSKTKAPVAGYRIVNVGTNQTLCVDAQQTCSDIDGPVCRWSVDGVTPLYRFNTPTMCGAELHKVP